MIFVFKIIVFMWMYKRVYCMWTYYICQWMSKKIIYVFSVWYLRIRDGKKKINKWEMCRPLALAEWLVGWQARTRLADHSSGSDVTAAMDVSLGEALPPNCREGRPINVIISTVCMILITGKGKPDPVCQAEESCKGKHSLGHSAHTRQDESKELVNRQDLRGS